MLVLKILFSLKLECEWNMYAYFFHVFNMYKFEITTVVDKFYNGVRDEQVTSQVQVDCSSSISFIDGFRWALPIRVLL